MNIIWLPWCDMNRDYLSNHCATKQPFGGHFSGRKLILLPDNNINKAMEDSEDMANYKDTDKAYNAMAPLYNTLKLFGLFYVNGSVTGRFRSTNRNNYKIQKATKLASCFVLFLLWIQLLRLLLMFRKDLSLGPHLLLKLALIIWNLHTVMAASNLFQACRTGKISKLHHCLTNVEGFDDHESELFCRKIALTYTVVGWVVFAINYGLGVYALFHTDLFDCVLAPFEHMSCCSTLVRICVLVVYIFSTAAWVFPVVLQYVYCRILHHYFHKFNVRFKLTCEDKDYEMNGEDVDTMKKQHANLCAFLRSVDSVLSCVIGITMATKTVLLCLVIYNLLWYGDVRNDIGLTVTHFFWAGAFLAVLGVVIGAAASVNCSAHGVYDLLYDVKVDETGNDVQLRVMLFLKRVSSGSLGLTALEMFVINKTTILTMAGMLITYFVVLVQFVQSSEVQSDSRSSTNNCNY